MTTTTDPCLEVHWDSLELELELELAFLTSMPFTGPISPSSTRRMMQRVIRAITKQVDLVHLGGVQRHLRRMLTTWSGWPDLLSAEYNLVRP
jgi:hypothetical protein